MTKSRRAFLQGAGGVMIGLPLAQFMGGFEPRALAQEPGKSAKLVTMYFPNGADAEQWTFEGALKPLADLKSKIILLQGVKNPVSEAASGRNPHEQGGAALFTGARLANDFYGTSVSMDQWLSRRIDTETLLQQPLVAGVARGFASGVFRSRSWLRRSWLESGDPVEPYVRPRDIFYLIFGNKKAAGTIQRQKSILDSVVEQFRGLTGDNSKIPSAHKGYLADHLENIRDLEKRISDFDKEVPAACQAIAVEPPEVVLGKDGLLPYSEFDRVYKLQMDLLVMALQCGATHTGSLMFGGAGEEFINPSISAYYSDHLCSHYSDEEQKALHLAYRRYHAGNLRYLLDKLGKAGILDETTVVYGSEFGDGTTHAINPMPHLIAGGGVNLKMGQVLNVDADKKTLCDVYTTVLEGIGHKVDSFGEKAFNTGTIKAMLKG